jgi:hypothetical protein
MGRPDPDRSARLRRAVDALPQRTRIAMLEGIDANRIIVGAYADRRSGGICPMLAAHRNGGRTDLASFARAWDVFTGATRPRLATRREIAVLRAQLEMSILRAEHGAGALAPLAAEVRAKRKRVGDRNRAADLRDRLHWAWMRPARRYDQFRDLLATAEEQLAEQRAGELLGDREPTHTAVGAD